jgi:hypothetical protein
MLNEDDALKKDGGKPRLDLVPCSGIEAAARAFTYGARKYAPRAWEGGAPDWEWGRLYASLQRHLSAFWRGEDFDAESGLRHLDHALAALMMLQAVVEAGAGKDDRSSLHGNL